MKERFAVLMASGAKVRSAARTLQVSERACFGWLLEPAVVGRIGELQRAMTAEAVGKLTVAHGAVAAELVRLTKSKDERMGHAACRSVFEFLTKSKEAAELERQVAELAAEIAELKRQGKQTRKR